MITVLKVGDFTLTQILRETKCDNLEASINAILADSEELWTLILYKFQPLKMSKYQTLNFEFIEIEWQKTSYISTLCNTQNWNFLKAWFRLETLY